MKPCTAILGWQGMVGGSAYRYFKKQGHEVMGWSRSNQTHTWEVINEKADWIIIAVPTPYDWEKKSVNITALATTLSKIKDGKKVIHKCTVPPGTTEQFQKEFPKLKILYNPEFLSEATCDEDFRNPDRQLIGYTKESYGVAIEALNLLPESAYGMIMTSTEAEMSKFTNNFHGALMVIFANFFYDLCQKAGGQDFEKVKKASQASKWVGSPMGRMYWDVFHGGFRGYGGKCFPKDVNMLLQWAKMNNIPCEILEACQKANERILKSQNITEAQAEKMSSRTEAK